MATPNTVDFTKTEIAASGALSPVLSGAPAVGRTLVAFVAGGSTAAWANGINFWTKVPSAFGNDTFGARGAFFVRPVQLGDTATIAKILTTNPTQAHTIHCWVIDSYEDLVGAAFGAIDATAGVRAGSSISPGGITNCLFLAGIVYEDATGAPTITASAGWTLKNGAGHTGSITSAAAEFPGTTSSGPIPTWTNSDTLTNQHVVYANLAIWGSTVTEVDSAALPGEVQTLAGTLATTDVGGSSPPTEGSTLAATIAQTDSNGTQSEVQSFAGVDGNNPQQIPAQTDVQNIVGETDLVEGNTVPDDGAAATLGGTVAQTETNGTLATSATTLAGSSALTESNTVPDDGTPAVQGTVAQTDTDATQSEIQTALSGSVSFAEADSTPTDALSPLVAVITATDSNISPAGVSSFLASVAQTDLNSGTSSALTFVGSITLTESDATPTDALGIITYVIVSSDSNAAQTETSSFLLQVLQPDFNDVQIDLQTTTVEGPGAGEGESSLTKAPGTPSEVYGFLLQVFRSGNWVEVPVIAAKGSIGKNRGGQLTVEVADDPSDYYRSRLFENEKVRAYRGPWSKPYVRCWTGYVDSPTIHDQGTKTREFIITDNIKEITDSMLTVGAVFDTFGPNQAAAAAIQNAIDTLQYRPTDDSGNYVSSTANYQFKNGNPICFFPDLLNSDGTIYKMASGTLGSFTQTTTGTPFGKVLIPVASGSSFSAFLLPNQYLIASTTHIFPPFALGTGNHFPPAAGFVFVDFYNGVMYFNPADASRTVSFSSSFFTQPLWAYPVGTKIGDVVAELFDKNGARWFVDGNGKFHAEYLDTVKPLSKVYGRGQYVNNGIQSNRDRRNVVICEGWNGITSKLLVSKAVNLGDIQNGPPIGLGKRQYIIAQDTTWATQTAVNNAAYFAIQQLSRRGKIATMEIIDDPTIALEDVIAFQGVLPETGEGDLFIVEQIDWEYDTTSSMVAKSTVMGTMMPGVGSFFVGPPNNITAQGQYDITADDGATVFKNISMSPTGGRYYSTFSKAAGLAIAYDPQVWGLETVDIFGSDGTHLQLNNFVFPKDGHHVTNLPVASMSVGVFYSIRVRFEQETGGSVGGLDDTDNLTTYPGGGGSPNLNFLTDQGSWGFFRTFIQARA